MSNNDLVLFDPKQVAVLGNRFLGAIVAHELAREHAEKEISDASRRENFIDLEFTKCAMYLHGEERIDLFKIYGSNQDSAVLYRSILVELGVLKRTISDNDTVEYSFTDPKLETQFHFPNSLKEQDEAEFLRRRSRRNSLNIRLARCCKAAIAMIESKATVSDITYRENAETKEREAVISKGPKEVMGKAKEAVIHTKNTAKIDGAEYTPTIAGLARVSDAKHKTTAKNDVETSTRAAGDKGANEADFLAMANAFIMVVKGREKTFSEAEKTAMKNVLTELKANDIK